MANVDPRNPIIKATEDEQDEVEGHLRARGPADGAMDPFDARLKAKDEQDEQEEVEGHLRARGPADGAMDPFDARLKATEDDGDDEVEGHRRLK